MKKTTALLLALLILVSLAPAALAENVTPGATTLTTEVPAASYVLNIPADAVVPFNAATHDLEVPTVTGASGFAVGKDVYVTITTTDFAADGISTTIPYDLLAANTAFTSGTAADYLLFKGTSDGGVTEAKFDYSSTSDHATIQSVTKLWLAFEASNWGKALAGNYTATITFTSDVVAAE